MTNKAGHVEKGDEKTTYTKAFRYKTVSYKSPDGGHISAQTRLGASDTTATSVISSEERESKLPHADNSSEQPRCVDTFGGWADGWSSNATHRMSSPSLTIAPMTCTRARSCPRISSRGSIAFLRAHSPHHNRFLYLGPPIIASRAHNAFNQQSTTLIHFLPFRFSPLPITPTPSSSIEMQVSPTDCPCKKAIAARTK